MVHFLVFTAIAVSSAVSTSRPVEWQADYGKALAATRADDRPLLVVLDVPGEPQSAAEGEQLELKGEQAELLAAYQLCHVDASSKYGQKVAKVFKADKFPFTAIIDKTGSVVLHKKQGQLTDAEWNETLSAYQEGERVQTTYHSAAYRGEGTKGGSTFGNPAASLNVVSPSYCPSCQKNAQQRF